MKKSIGEQVNELRAGLEQQGIDPDTREPKEVTPPTNSKPEGDDDKGSGKPHTDDNLSGKEPEKGKKGKNADSTSNKKDS